MAIDVPDYVQSAARRGLEWHAEGKSGDGVTDKTLREAREMADGSVSEDKLRRMGPWFRRHEPDMDAPRNKPDNEDFPGAGAVNARSSSWTAKPPLIPIEPITRP